MPTLRIQPLSASTGAMAIENMRLQDERERLEREIEALASGLPAEAAAIVHKADALMAEHGARIAELKSKRDAIDRAFDVTERERRAAAERAREEERAASRQSLVAAAETELALVEQAQGHLRAFVDALNGVFAAHDSTRAAATKVAGAARAPNGLAGGDLISRMGGSIAGTLATVRVPGALAGGVTRIGSLGLPGGSLYPADQDWRHREERLLMPAVQQLLRHSHGESERG